ncbi:hypothetical protein SNE25_08340 [Mucilaginibacter sabulilitoris]|uniref:Glycosyltransferase family 1 protein n=1 Tax=Mucilaginibacter sabulilitoris TaxID=1173583 RepID=A0ABZ0TWL9_9SPHI|nr:hypothetical protein [Mucilaginibacter sabulilitoris]WPU95530.1 hypothetical protein SNE25_08340 [Mucilaginibacter sabulilitoris]
MKILINGLLLNEKSSGIQYATQNLLRALSENDRLEHDIEVLVSGNYSNSWKESKHFKTHRLPFNSTNRMKRVFYEHFNLERYFKKTNSIFITPQTAYYLIFQKLPLY